MELVIMAAGMGSRFGGLKQIEPVDPNGNFIIDYSIFDAIRCGFDKVVFIIKKENLEAFKSTVGLRIEKFVDVEYVFQDTSNIPTKYNIPTERTKPFGTGHAVLAAKPAINDSFAVINADDFYGYDAFVVLAEFLKNNTIENKYAIVGYHAINTMGSAGSVKRGVCKTENGMLKSITESSLTPTENGDLIAKAIDGSNDSEHSIDPNTIVSMNMFGFTKSFGEHLQNKFDLFLEKNKNDLSGCEYFLPTVVSELIQENKAVVDVLDTSAKWFGITYKQDKEEVEKAIAKFVSDGVYPINLWEGKEGLQ